MNNPTSPSWLESFEDGFFCGRFEYTDKAGKRRWEIMSVNNGFSGKQGALEMMYKIVDEHSYGSLLTDFVENKNIKRFISTELSAAYNRGKEEERERIREAVEKEVAGLAGIIESNLRDSGQIHIAEMKLEKILALLSQGDSTPKT